MVDLAILCDCLEVVNKVTFRLAKQDALVEAGITWTFKSLDTNYTKKLSELKTNQTKKNEAFIAAEKELDDFCNDPRNKDILTIDGRDVKRRVTTKEEGTNANLQTAQRECLEQAIRKEKINKTISDKRERLLNKWIASGELDPKDKYTEETTRRVTRDVMNTPHVKRLLEEQRERQAAGVRVADYLPVNGAIDFHNYGIQRSLLDNNNGEGEEQNTGDDDGDNNGEGEEWNTGDDDGASDEEQEEEDEQEQD